MRSLFKNYPLPLFVIFGLSSGVIFFSLHLNHLAHLIWFATLILGGIPIVYGTLRGMLQGHFASDIVAMLAIVSAALLNEAFAGAVVVLMQSGGEALEKYGMRKASFSLTALLQRAPRKARRKNDGALEEIDAESVQVGDILVVRSGELIPVDGIIVKGSAEIDASALTGEPLAQQKKEGDLLLSGSVDVNGVIEMRAAKSSQESQYAKIVKLVKKAQEEKAPIQRLADRYAVVFTPITLLMAWLGYLITHEPVTALAVLVVATPCPLILATPLAVICGINRSATEGIIVKEGAAIEQIASAKAALFDKTGTVTFGSPVIATIRTLSEMNEEEILLAAASIEQFSTHSIAKGIVASALKKHSHLPLPQNFSEVPGQGVSGELSGRKFAIGSLFFVQKFVKDLRIDPSWQEGESIGVFVLRDHILVGVITLTDQMRPNAERVMRELRSLGVQKIAMLTGDHERAAAFIARQAGIDPWFSELLPEQKVEIVHQFKKEYSPLIMIGDGINDAPALASATIGIAMGAHGTAISAEAANVVLLVDDLGKISEAVRIGQRMLKIAKQSIFIGMGLSFALMGVACFGWIDPPFGALLQEVVDVAVILNALRVLR